MGSAKTIKFNKDMFRTQVANMEGITAYRITGDCMEGANIPDGSILLGLNDTVPKGHGCIFIGIEVSGVPMCKRFVGNCANGIAGMTHYAGNRKNEAVLIIESLGVVVACIKDQEVLWENPCNVDDYRKVIGKEPSNVYFNKRMIEFLNI